MADRPAAPGHAEGVPPAEGSPNTEPARDDEQERELWQRVDGRGPYKWMVWTVGPMTDGAKWFKTEDEARAALAAREETHDN